MTTTQDYKITDEEMEDLVKMPYLAQSCQIVSLITRLREAEKDAARYRWLRERGDAYQWENILGFDLDDFMMEDDALDHAIDVYMQEHTK